MRSPRPLHLAPRLWLAFALAALAALAAALAWRIAHPVRIRDFEEPFSGESAFFAFHRTDAGGGWMESRQGLWLPPGGEGLRQYKFPKRADWRIGFSLRFRLPPGGMNRAHLSGPAPKGEVPRTAQWDDSDLDWSFADRLAPADEALEGQGFFFWTLHARNGSGPATGEPILSRIGIRFEAPARSPRWGAAAFYLALCLIAAALALLIILPLALAALRACRGAGGVGRRSVLALALAAAAGYLALKDEWRQTKYFDDLAAYGNAAMLADNGFDTREVYFRSRIRPGLIGWLAPWAWLLPNQLSSATFAPSDRQERMFFFYDRLGPLYGGRVYPEASVFFLALALAAALATGGMARRLGASRTAAALASAFATLFLGRMLYNCLSLAADLAALAAAGYLGAWAWRRPAEPRLAAAGLALSLCLAQKETSVILATAMALFQFWTWRGARGRSRFFEFALYWLSAASLPIIYYGLILDTGFAEIPLNHSLLRYHMEFHRYEPLTPATGARTYWQAFGLGLPLAALGLARAVRRGRWRDSDRLFACWLAASLWTLAMPFLFPRFLLYSLPPFAYFAALAAEWLAKKDWPFVDKRARGSQPLSAAGQ